MSSALWLINGHYVISFVVFDWHFVSPFCFMDSFSACFVFECGYRICAGAAKIDRPVPGPNH